MAFDIGLLGAGFIADFHVRALSHVPGARIAWICDADRRKADSAASRIPGCQSVASLDAMLASKPHAVHVLLPPGAHAAATLSCLAAGAHVLVEKPLATSRQDAATIVAAAKEAGRVVGVNHNLLFNPSFRKLVAAIHARALGELEHVSIGWNVPLRQLQTGQHGHWMFREPHHILLEQGVHPLSALHFLLGDLREVSVLASETSTLSTGAEFHRTWQVSLGMARGTAQLRLSFGRDYPEVTLHAVGQDGTATVDLRRNTIRFHGNTVHEPPLDDLFAGLAEGASVARQAAGNFGSTILGMLKVRPPFDPFADSIRASVQSFYAAVESKSEPIAGAASGAEVVGMCEAIGAAAATGSRPRRVEGSQG